MSVIIRRMLKEDIPQVAEIEKIAFTRPWTKSVFNAVLLLPYAAYYVAVDTDPSAGPEPSVGENEGDGAGPSSETDPSAGPGRIVGVCGVKKIFAEGEISNVAVHPDYRCRGICRRMLERLIKEARCDGVQAFTLEVRAGNDAAVHLYESLGFSTEGIRPRFYEKPVEDALIMWLREK